MTDMRKVEAMLEGIAENTNQAVAAFNRIAVAIETAGAQMSRVCDALEEQNREDRIRDYRSELPRHQG